MRAENLFFSYPKTPVLQGASFEIEPGEMVGIIGPNGGGKTTLLKLIMGFLEPDGGFLQKIPREMIGYVPQVNHIDRDFPITVQELVMLGGMKNSFFDPPNTKETALFWIEELGLEAYKSKAFSALSGGLQQKALLARALVSDPEFLLLDEPTANIDPVSRMFIIDKLETFKGNKTILLVSHDLQTTIEKVDKILCVQSQITTYLPQEICEHFALGLYHTPLLAKRSLADVLSL